jgi:hypothetical protein
MWLKITGVEMFDQRFAQAGVRVTAEINGNSYVYPSIGGAKWSVIGPDMAPAVFKLPQSSVFQITFSMIVKSQGDPDESKFISQRTVIVRKDQIPYSGNYELYLLGTENFRGGAIAAQIRFAISTDPS